MLQALGTLIPIHLVLSVFSYFSDILKYPKFSPEFSPILDTSSTSMYLEEASGLISWQGTDAAENRTS